MFLNLAYNKVLKVKLIASFYYLFQVLHYFIYLDLMINLINLHFIIFQAFLIAVSFLEFPVDLDLMDLY